MNKELCWLITSKCNEDCEFCHSFKNTIDLPLKKNKQILDNLINHNIKNVTWSGGEALLYENIDVLLKFSYFTGIKNTLITNGQTYIKSAFNYIHEVVFSLDSIDSSTNKIMGRGEHHFDNLCKTLNLIKTNHPDVKIRINTVLNSYNVHQIKEISNFIKANDISNWRIHKFIALRGKATKNNENFSISNEQFNSVIKKIKNNSIHIQSRKEEDYYNLYYLINSNGDFLLSDDNGDKLIGKADDPNIFERVTGIFK